MTITEEIIKVCFERSIKSAKMFKELMEKKEKENQALLCNRIIELQMEGKSVSEIANYLGLAMTEIDNIKKEANKK